VSVRVPVASVVFLVTILLTGVPVLSLRTRRTLKFRWTALRCRTSVSAPSCPLSRSAAHQSFTTSSTYCHLALRGRRQGASRPGLSVKMELVLENLPACLWPSTPALNVGRRSLAAPSTWAWCACAVAAPSVVPPPWLQTVPL